MSSAKGLFFLTAGMFAMGCEDYLFAGLLPGLSASLQISLMAAAQGCSIFGLAYLFSVPLCLFLLSKKTVRQVLIFALVLLMAGNIMTLLSSNFTSYLASRFLAGLGAGLFPPVAVTASAQAVEPHFRGRALSLMWGSNCAGAVVGVPLGLWLESHLGWRSAIALILLLATFALLGLMISKPRLQIETPLPSLRDQFHLLTDPRVLSVIAVTLLTTTGCLGLYTYISPILSGTENSAAIAFSLWSVGGLIGSLASGYIVDRSGKPQVVMSMILVILGITSVSLPALREIPHLGLLPFFVLGVMGWASVTPQLCSLIEIQADREAILVALNSSAVSLGSVIGTALGGMALAGGLNGEKLPFAAFPIFICALVLEIRQRSYKPLVQ